MKKFTKKIVVWGMMACLSITAVPATSFAEQYPESNYNHHEEHDRYDRKYDRRYEHHRNHIVMERIRVEEYYMDFLRENNLTLGDLITAKQISDVSGRLSTEDVLRMRLSGKSYKSIARKYDVYWRKVNRDVDNIYRDMRNEAMKQGIVLWALDEVVR
ncbi:MAG: hypothetical protein H6Q70_3977 [Firmicutes bacterium]|nr:hypothetical protein [Bacillota bacterium]